jgi:hypothetical protein
VASLLAIGLPVALFLAVGLFPDDAVALQLVAPLRNWLAVTCLAIAPIALVSIGLLVGRRWRPWVAAAAASMQIALTAIAFALVAAVYGARLFPGLTDAPILLPPIFIFVIMAAYDLMALGARYAAIERGHAPRNGRVLIYFGAVLLILGPAVTMFTVHDIIAMNEPSVIERFANGGFIVGLVLLGVPYLIFTTIRNPKRLTGASMAAEVTRIRT